MTRPRKAALNTPPPRPATHTTMGVPTRRNRPRARHATSTFTPSQIYATTIHAGTAPTVPSLTLHPSTLPSPSPATSPSPENTSRPAVQAVKYSPSPGPQTTAQARNHHHPRPSSTDTETNRDLTQNQRIIITGTLTGNNGTYSLENPSTSTHPPSYPAPSHPSTQPPNTSAPKPSPPPLKPPPHPHPRTRPTARNHPHPTQPRPHYTKLNNTSTTPPPKPNNTPRKPASPTTKHSQCNSALAQRRHHTHTASAPTHKTAAGSLMNTGLFAVFPH